MPRMCHLQITLITMDITKMSRFPDTIGEVYGKPLIYFDNGATTQKPRCVVDAIVDEYYSVNANVHQALLLVATGYRTTRRLAQTVRRFINARTSAESHLYRGASNN